MTYTVDWLSYQWGLFLSTISAFNKHQRLLLSGNCYPGYQGAAHPRQTFLGVCHMFLPHKRLLKREGKIVDQSQHTSNLGSTLSTLRNSAQDFRKDQKGLTFRTNCSISSHTFVPREIIQPLSPTFLSRAKLFGHVQQMYHTLYWACVLFGWSTLWLQWCRSVLR